MARRRLLLLVSLLLLIIASQPLLAQADLTEKVQVAGGGLTLTIAYPEGWFGTTNEDAVLVASSTAALDELKTKGVVTTAGETGLAAYLPSFLDNVSVAHDAAPEQAIEGFLTVTKTQGKVQSSTDFSVPAATAVVTPPGMSLKSLIGALAFPDGTVLFGVIPSSNLDATALAIINSMTLATPAGIPDVTPDSSVNLTPTSFKVRDQLIDFNLSIGLPDGWVNRYNDGFLYLGNSETALEKANSQSPVYEPGETTITLLMPPAVPQLGIPRDSEPEGAINLFVSHSKAQGRVVSDDTFAGPAAHAALTGGNLPVGGGDIFALKFNRSLVFLVVQPSGAIDGTVMAILHSIEYGPAVEIEATPTVKATTEPAATATTVTAAKELRQWATYADGTSQYGADDWSFMQATGKPNTPTCGDNTTAWASEDSTGRAVLRVAFAQPVIASQINIYQSYNPGAIVEVDLGNSRNADKVLPLPHSADPVGNTTCPGAFSIDVNGVDTPVDFVVIYLDQSLTGDWNEIDAVELVGTPVG